MSNYIEHAKREFLALGYKPISDEEDGPNKWIQENIMELLNVFAKQGHSGSSAPYCVRMFSKLALWEPLAPLTGEENEWNEIGDGIFQNKRCSRVFKEGNRAYDIEGKVFCEPDGCCFTSKDSHVDITFSYTPKTEYVQVEQNKC